MIIFQQKIPFLFIILAFFVFVFVIIEFGFFIYKTPKCIYVKESFDTNCITSNVILLSDILTDIKLDSDSQLQKIQQIQFNASESGQFNPIIQSSKMKPDQKIENLKQVIMENYILKCNNPKYNNMSKINDIKYLNSNDSRIKTCLKNKQNPTFQVLEINEITQQNIYT